MFIKAIFILYYTVLISTISCRSVVQTSAIVFKFLAPHKYQGTISLTSAITVFKHQYSVQQTNKLTVYISQQ